VLDNYKEVAEALERTNESIIDQRQSRILRILTVLTVLFLPLTFVTGLFGMNTGVPWEGSIHGFWVVTVAIAALGGGMITAFKLARWL
jgi:Mg2+ and Co2+ transporter CorA